MDPLFRTVYRPSKTPVVDVPLGARSVGHYRVLPGYYDTRKTRIIDFAQVFWGVSGTGAIVIDGVSRWIAPGQIGVYLPGMQHRIHALDAPWELRWWTMDGPLAAPTVAAFGLARADVYTAGPAPLALFLALETAMGDITPDGERRASARAYELLSAAAGGRPRMSADRMVQSAVEIIHAEWSNPSLDIRSIAQRLNLHRSSLSRRFHAAIGIPPNDYITNLRVQDALSLLKQTDAPVKEIARRCGWEDPNYFSRCIRQATGLPPRAFRNQ